MHKLLTAFSLCFMTSFLFGQSISNVSPNSGERGTMQLPITISGTGTNFSNATSSLVRIKESGGSILEVLSVISVSTQSVSVNVRIANSAPLGAYTVSVYDSVVGDLVDLSNGFTVLANNTPPALGTTTPGNAAINQILPITISVADAHFDQATDNTIYLTQQGTSTILMPVPGSTVALNGNFLRALFEFADPTIVVGSTFDAHVGNSFDGYFADMAAVVVTGSTAINGNINYAGSYTGVVELYQQNINMFPYSYSLVATSAVDALNDYDFANVAEANYYIRSVPVGMSDVVATYFPSDIAWQTATMVTTDALVPGPAHDITPVTSLSLGGGVTVNGTLGYGPSGFFKMASAVVAEGIEVFLKDVDNVLYAQAETDQNGEYSFVGLPNGNYQIIVDLPGYAQISTYDFTIDGASTDLSGLDFLIDDGEIFKSSFLGVSTLEMEDLEIYPNPTHGILNIKLPSNLTNATLSIHNQLGQKVHEEEVQTGASHIFTTNISGIVSGFYTVKILGDNFVSETKMIKK